MEFNKTGLMINGAITIIGALLILFPKTFLWGNFIMARGILLIICLHLLDQDLKGMTIRITIPFAEFGNHLFTTPTKIKLIMNAKIILILLFFTFSLQSCAQTTSTNNTNPKISKITMSEESILKPVKTLIQAMETEDAVLIRKQFATTATQAYGADGKNEKHRSNCQVVRK
ncbi:MAG: hypothetical protein MZV64_03480 [Ignavibacteriales bacterium]|nr:hypothetical protein [Ignavibacteriales bacterium]